MKANGLKITWKEWAFISGTMAVCIKDNIRTIRSTDSVFIHGLTVDATKDTGTRASSTVLAPIACQINNKLNMVSGKMESALNGLVRSKFHKLMNINSTTLSSLIRLAVIRWYHIKHSS